VKIGVYICHCGKNIAGVVDVEKVAKEAEKFKHVSIVRHYTFMCSKKGQELIKEDIRSGRVDRVVVAACSPKMHEETFRRAVEEAGLNGYLLEIANIREQCSWVHGENPKEATDKAIDLIHAAVMKVSKYKPIEKREFKVRREVLIIGGGISGIRAALDLAKAGLKVYLVEREPTIGGNMARIDKTFPTLDCSLCILTPLMNEISTNRNITLLTNSEILNVEGRVGDFKVKVLVKPRYVRMDRCISCGLCAEKCPVKVPDEYNCGLSMRKAIYKPFPQAIPSTYIIDSENCLKLNKNICGICMKICPTQAINYEDKAVEMELKVGAIIIATGYELLDPRKISEYNYDGLKDIYTGMEFERIYSAEGPTKGRIISPRNGKTPRKIGIILCAGSRDERYLPYCCNIGCMAGLKHAYYIATSNPEAKVYIFYTDIRAAGKGYEEFYRRIRKMKNIFFIRGKPMEIEEENGKLKVDIYDTNAGELFRFKLDMIILETGLIPNPNVEKIISTLKVSRSMDGFILEAHPKLRPVETAIRGIYVCGCAQGLKDIPASIAQASAAAAETMKLLLKGKVEAEPYTIEIDEEKCSGCGICTAVCPYNAIRVDSERGIAEVDEASCRGCGTCAAACPTKAINQRNFTDEVISSALTAILRR